MTAMNPIFSSSALIEALLAELSPLTVLAGDDVPVAAP